jgi:hypothetical protein
MPTGCTGTTYPRPHQEDEVESDAVRFEAHGLRRLQGYGGRLEISAA